MTMHADPPFQNACLDHSEDGSRDLMYSPNMGNKWCQKHPPAAATNWFLTMNKKELSPSSSRSDVWEQYDFTSLGSFRCCVIKYSPLWFIM